MKFIKNLFLIWVFFVGFVCSSFASTQITNGVTIEDDEMGYVVKVKAYFDGSHAQSCTATFVSDSTLITAAHCIDSLGATTNRVEITRGNGLGALSRLIFRHPEYYYRGALNDVAVIVFEDKTSDQWIPVANVYPRAGDAIELVGYGKFNHFERGDGVKRKGTNQIELVNTRINFNAESKPSNATFGPGENAGNSLGDSGGPMFDQVTGRLVGVASTVDSTTNLQAQLHCHYANLQLSKHMQFLRSTLSRGAKIDGI